MLEKCSESEHHGQGWESDFEEMWKLEEHATRMRFGRTEEVEEGRLIKRIYKAKGDSPEGGEDLGGAGMKD